MATKTIGSGGGRDYATIALWESYLDGLGALSAPEIGECYNDSEFNEAVTFSGCTPSSTNTVTLRPATGEGFRAASTKVLRYDTTKGVAWKSSSSGYHFRAAIDYMTVFGMQIKTIGGAYVLGVRTDNAHDIIDSSIITADDGFGLSINPGVLINCLVYFDHTGSNPLGARQGSFYGCTIVRTSNRSASGTGIFDQGYTFLGTIKNCAIFGFTTQWGTDVDFAGGNTYCATDQASFPSTVTGGVTSLTYTSQFVEPSNTGTDFTALASGGLKAGTPDNTNTPVDIFGTTRDATTPYIGCYEVSGGGATNWGPLIALRNNRLVGV